MGVRVLCVWCFECSNAQELDMRARFGCVRSQSHNGCAYHNGCGRAAMPSDRSASRSASRSSDRGASRSSSDSDDEDTMACQTG